MLTGRWDRIDTIRQYKGLNGFLLRTESEHDCLRRRARRHRALGRARDGGGARPERRRRARRRGRRRCGLHLRADLRGAEQHRDRDEALHRRAQRQRMVDRPERRGHRQVFQRPHDQPRLLAPARQGREFRGEGRGQGDAHAGGARSRRAPRTCLFRACIFEEFGLRYYGPIDGHDIPLLIKTFEFLKEQDEPVILHIITEKGRGYEPALEKPGEVPRPRASTRSRPGRRRPRAPTYSQVFAQTLTAFAKKDPTSPRSPRPCPAAPAWRISRRRSR